MSIPPDQSDIQQIVQYVKNLEARISQIEARLKLESEAEEDVLPPLIPNDVADKADKLELHIGEYWFAKVGIVVFAVGIAFLLTLPYTNLSPALPSVLGFFIVAIIYALSYYLRASSTYLSRYLMGGAMVLLYFTTMRLHFFSPEPAVNSRLLETLFLLIVVITNLTIANYRRSVYLVGLSLTMGYITALISENPYFIFTLITLLSALVVYFKLKYRWHNLLIFGTALTYLTHCLWFLNNPFLSKTVALVSTPHVNILFILVYALIFAMGNFYRNKKLPENNTLIISTFLNCGGAYGLFLIETLLRFQQHFTGAHLLASILFLSLAVAFWVREKSRFSTFFYAMLGYGALSVAIIWQFDKPDYFIWLSWQSIVVISTAIWFRSKFIIFANFFIYAILFIAYLLIAGKVSAVSLSFGVVALLSARILNWQKHRLELKTEFMRNAYLIFAFFIFPYALYQFVPGRFVSLSWMGVTLLYYALSLILHNKKYRWLALATLLITVLRVFLVDTTGVEPIFRVISFLALGIVLIIISVLYARVRAKNINTEKNEKN